MVSKKISRSKKAETDGTYLLKVVMYLLFGSLWIKFGEPIQVGALLVHGLPFGLLVGLLFARHDHFQVDRKIEYVLLLVMAVITYFLPAGIVI
ncbi:hypothetical protein KBD87_03310 [Candidatus Saccharibacteria bacterium]|jgi:hypothetical protein|nr:hypothetical protein [Candidatus Saccharibacteria bacterium]